MDILVVDDDDAIRSLWVTVLQRAGHQVMSASNGQEALNYLRQIQSLPNLILLDLMMPTMDGWQFLKERKQQPLLASVPVIVISAAEFHKSQVGPLGVAGYLQKPVSIKSLLEAVAQFGP
jgi:two-component system response regulator MprA